MIGWANTYAAHTQSLADGRIGGDERALLFTCATNLKYPLPPVHRTLDISKEIDSRCSDIGSASGDAAHAKGAL